MNDIYQIIELPDHSFTFSRVQLPGLGGGSNAALSGKPHYFYPGTIEQFEADPNKAAILEQIAADGVLFTTVDLPPVNPDGTFDEDALKEWLEENYLKLTGGTLTGALVLRAANVDQSSETETDITDDLLVLKDKSNISLVNVQALQNGSNVQVQCVVGLGTGSDRTYGAISFKKSAAGGVYLHGSTPGADASDDAYQTKASVANSFLAKTGGTLTGNIVSKHSSLDSSQLEANENIFWFPFWQADKNGQKIGEQQICFNTSGDLFTAFSLFREINSERVGKTYLHGRVNKSGEVFTSVAETTDSYGNLAVTTKYFKDHALQKVPATSIHVGGQGASDTAGLHNGRGLTASLPFATLEAALWWAESYLAGGSITLNIILHSDLSITARLAVYAKLFYLLKIMSDTTKRTLTLGDGINLRNGSLTLENLKLQSNGAIPYFLQSNGYYSGTPNIILDTGLEFNGSVSDATIVASYGGQIQAGTTYTGAVIGKRYKAMYGGRIIVGGRGVNAIPGTESGTVDATSVYA